MKTKTMTPEEFMEALENLAKIKKEGKEGKEGNKETSTEQDNYDPETPYVVKIAFEDGGVTTITITYQTMLDLLKAIKEKKESFIAIDTTADPFFIACNKVLTVLTHEDTD